MNWTKRGFVTALFAAVGAVSSTWGANEITVVIWDSGGPRVTVMFDAGEAINAANGLPTILSSDTRVNIFSTSTTTLANAGRVTFAANSRSSNLEVVLGSTPLPTVQTPLSNAL